MSVFNSPIDRQPLPQPERRPLPPAASQSFGPSTPGGAPAESPASRPSVLGKTLIFKGELSADEDLILQGRVEGAIRHTQSLTVGTDGVVIGDIHARSIVVEGTVEGDLHGSASVLIAATAKVRGNIVAPRVGITEGAVFNGSVDMSSAAAAAHAAPRGTSHGSIDTGLTDPAVERLLGRV